MTSNARRAARAGVAAALLATWLLSLPAPTSSADSAGDFTEVDAHVRGAMEASGVPGIAYAVTQDGKVVHLAAFGSAGPGDTAMSPQTTVVIGSVGKSITALAVRQLIAAGRLDIDAPVARYLPWFSLAGPEGARELVTIRSLLDHTSGLSTADGQDPQWYAPGRSPDDVVRGLAEVRATVPPGTYQYSNLNYVVLGAVIEAVSGEAYHGYVRDHIFAPLGMTSSVASLTAAAAGALAQGHRYLFGIPVAFDEPYPTGMVAAGYQVSSAGDMARYVAALANGGVYEGADIVAPDRPSPVRREYGTDWQPLAAGQAGAIVGQSGSTLTSNADILLMPSRGLGVVVLLNANPTQVMDMPSGAADIALDVMHRSFGTAATSSAPTVRTVYLVADLVLLVLVALFAAHAIRARTWRRRLAAARHPRLLIARAILADLVLPLIVLLGIPLWIGSTGSSHPGDVISGWRFMLWTLPDLATTLLALAFGGLLVGVAKIVLVQAAPPRKAPGLGEQQA